MIRHIVFALLSLFWLGMASAQPRIQLEGDTRVVSEHYKNSNRDWVVLTANLWQNDLKYDRKTEEHLTFVRQELGRRGFARTNEELPPFGDEFFNGSRKYQHVKDSRPHLCEITLEYWPGPQLKMSRETYAKIECRSVRRWDDSGFPRSKATSDYGRKILERFDEDLALARLYQAKVNAELKP